MVTELKTPALRKRKVKDVLLTGGTYLFSSVSLISLLAILIFVFSQGYKNLSWDFVTGDYNASVWTVETNTAVAPSDNTFTYTEKTGEYFSSRWGIAFTAAKDKEGNPTTEVSYVDVNANITSWIDSSTKAPFSLKVGSVVSSVLLWTTPDVTTAEVLVPDVKKPENVRDDFQQATYLKSLTLSYGGQGMRGSLMSTLYLIILTLGFALPLGIGSAIYLGIYAKDSKFTAILRNAIDMITGIPSIVFGLVGGILFLPITSGKTSLIAGSLTLAAMILPIIIKSTEESLRAIPHSLPLASLALGASQTQTTFKVMLPNAVPGILTSVLLGIGRIIGESAALVYTAGVSIQDYIIPTQGSASLAVHIWDLMSGEHQNIEASCSIAIVILVVILVLSIFIKLLSYKIIKAQKGK
jgi:phosphate transport system permease protein